MRALLELPTVQSRCKSYEDSPSTPRSGWLGTFKGYFRRLFSSSTPTPTQRQLRSACRVRVRHWIGQKREAPCNRSYCRTASTSRSAKPRNQGMSGRYEGCTGFHRAMDNLISMFPLSLSCSGLSLMYAIHLLCCPQTTLFRSSALLPPVRGPQQAKPGILASVHIIFRSMYIYVWYGMVGFISGLQIV